MEYDPGRGLGPSMQEDLIENDDEGKRVHFGLPGSIVEVRTPVAMNRIVDWRDICLRTGAKLIIIPKRERITVRTAGGDTGLVRSELLT